MSDLDLYMEAIARMWEPVKELTEETGSDGEPDYIPPWGVLFSADTCPPRWLPYLAMYVGVQIPAGATVAEARALVKAEAGFQRGTVKSIETAIRRVLAAEAGNVVKNPDFSTSEAF